MLDEAAISHPNLKVIQYVRHLASYISDPSTIRARTKDMFGKAPPMDTITALRAEHEGRKKKLWNNFLDDRFDDDPRVRLPKPVKVEVAPPPPPPPPPPVEEPPLPEPKEVPCVSVGKAVIASVARAYGITAMDITGHRRAAIIVDARSIVTAVLRARNWSYPMIGWEMGDRDHSTILNQVTRMPARLKRDPFMQKVLDAHLEAFKL